MRRSREKNSEPEAKQVPLKACMNHVCYSDAQRLMHVLRDGVILEEQHSHTAAWDMYKEFIMLSQTK